MEISNNNKTEKLTKEKLLVKKLLNHGFFKTVKRISYLPYDINFALRVVIEIGKNRESKFTIDKENEFVFTNLIRWVHADPEFQCLDLKTEKIEKGDLTKGIYIAGNTGTGKSMALEIISEYTKIEEITFKAGGIDKKLSFESNRTDDICAYYSKTGDLTKYKKNKIICFQDLGSDSEPLESLYMGNRLSVMQAILESRGDKSDQITLITSNLPLLHKSFLDKYHDRVVSRLFKKVNYFELKGIDRRKI